MSSRLRVLSSFSAKPTHAPFRICAWTRYFHAAFGPLNLRLVSKQGQTIRGRPCGALRLTAAIRPARRADVCPAQLDPSAHTRLEAASFLRRSWSSTDLPAGRRLLRRIHRNVAGIWLAVAIAGRICTLQHANVPPACSLRTRSRSAAPSCPACSPRQRILNLWCTRSHERIQRPAVPDSLLHVCRRLSSACDQSPACVVLDDQGRGAQLRQQVVRGRNTCLVPFPSV